MKRNEWTWQKSATDLANAADSQAHYHGTRVAFWKDQRAQAEQDIHDKGLDVRHRPQTGGDRHEVIVDPELARRLGECDSKIQRHQLSVEEYGQWADALRDAGGRTLELDHADWTFFYGGTDDEDE